MTPSEHAEEEEEEEPGQSEHPGQTIQAVQQKQREAEEEPEHIALHKEISPELEPDVTTKSETPASGEII